MPFPRYVREHEGTLWEISADVWGHVGRRHPEVAGLLERVEETLRDPDEIRRSRTRQETVLYYKYFEVLPVGRLMVRKKHLCVIADYGAHEVKTIYLTIRIKQGIPLWRKG